MKYEIPNFEYIIEKVKSSFNDKLDIHFDYFLINQTYPLMETETIFSNLLLFLKTQVVKS